jgi:vitamin B12 transporter
MRRLLLLPFLLPLAAQAQDAATTDDRDAICEITDCSYRAQEREELTAPVSVSAITPEILVQAGGPLDPLGLNTEAVTTITTDRITATASNRIEDVLRDVAGLTQFRRTDARSANATSQGATLRGLGGNASSRALLVLDGVPQTDPFGGWVTWPAFAANRIGLVRVTRGGGKAEYGPGALAGLIEFDSISPARNPGLSGSVAYGSRDGIEGNALLSGPLGGGSGFLAASYARGDGFIPIIRAQRGPADRASPYEQASLAARGVAPLSAQTELQASFLAFTDRRERGTILSGNGGDGADASVRIVHRGAWQVQALAYAQLRKFQSRFVAIDAARATVTQTVDQYNVPSTGIGAKIDVRPPLGKDVTVRIGSDWRRTVGETRELFTYVAGKPTRGREAGGNADTLGLFAEGALELDDVTLSAGARIDRWSLGNGRLVEHTLATGALLRNEQAADRNGWEPTARVGLAWTPGDWTLRGAAYASWRLPTLNELYRPFRVGADATAANAALRPETMRGGEIGLGYRWQGGGIGITAFHNRLKNAIANVTLGRGPGVFPGVGFVAAGGAYRQRLNISAIRSRGLELDVDQALGDFRLSASYAYTDARVQASGTALPLNTLLPAQVPSHLASGTLGWRWLSGTLRWTSAQFEDDLNLRRLGGAVTLDTVANIPLGKRLALSLRGENITNSRVDAAISATGVIERATPRTLWVGLTLKP